ncbi:aminoglycoside phosphotransferase family protein [Thalassotalea euphylliae]|uniref:aminoglycoside phosphotransferase family protein n=1 Tax=Thalassotalea euphylliae TaxID=1655234 RepID=UPI00362C6C54
MSLGPQQPALVQWLEQCGYHSHSALTPLTGDAGFRQYFRFNVEQQTYLAVTSPPALCNNDAFVAVCQHLQQASIHTPKIHHFDEQSGFFVIEDFGEQLLADVLSDNSMHRWYHKALSLIPIMAKANSDNLPNFDREFVERELHIFTEWLLVEYLQLTLTDEEQRMLQKSFVYLNFNIQEQPHVFMHRDYHSRNIMVLDDGELGVIDFQDAVKGPITYDIVSLLRDCYVRWPDAQVIPLLDEYIAEASQAFELNIAKSTWYRWFDLTGLQRHIKAAGIFARLLLRDNKPGYIKDIPLTLTYIIDIGARYPELAPLSDFVAKKVAPALKAKSV